jgi:hypothetical protein
VSTLFQRFGGFEFPAEAQDVTDTLAPLDPGRDILLGLFAQALTSELSAAWAVVSAGTVLAGTSVVQSQLPLAPSPELITTVAKPFPLLAVSRTGTATFEEHTLDIERMTQQWDVAYVLGPLPPEDQRRLVDVLQAAAKVIALTVKRRGHPDYDNGALQFFAGKGHFGAARVAQYEVGQAKFAGGDDAPHYHVLSLQLETVEYESWLEGAAAPMEGMSMSIGVGNDGGFLPDVVRIDSDTIPD